MFKLGHLFLTNRSIKDDPVPTVREIFVQEIMTLAGSEFEGEAIDMDSIAFACKFIIFPS